MASDEVEPIVVAGEDTTLLHAYKRGQMNRIYLDDHGRLPYSLPYDRCVLIRQLQGHVNFKLLGGSHRGRQQYTRIEFICDPDVDEVCLTVYMVAVD